MVFFTYNTVSPPCRVAIDAIITIPAVACTKKVLVFPTRNWIWQGYVDVEMQITREFSLRGISFETKPANGQFEFVGNLIWIRPEVPINKLIKRQA